MMTVKQVSEKLAVSAACVYRLIDSGRLLAHRIGVGRGTIRVSEEALETYLAASEVHVEKRKSNRTHTPLRHIQW